MFTRRDYNDAMSVFTIERVKERLVEDEDKLIRLENLDLLQEKDQVWNNQAGTTIRKATDKGTVELNKNVLRQNIVFWNNILSMHSELEAG